MSVKFRSDAKDTWVPAGLWFQQLVELAAAIENYRAAAPNNLKRVLLMVPSRALVANGIAWGYSKIALLNPAPALIQKPIEELVHLSSETKIQLMFPVHRGQTQKQIRVGVFQSIVIGSPTSKVGLLQDGRLFNYNLLPSVTFAIVPDFTPEGDYWEPLAEGNKSDSAVRNFFNSQQNPQAIIFTELGAYQEELAFEFQDSALAETLGVDAVSLEEATRVDRYSDDQHSHFVNSWEHFRDYEGLRASFETKLDAYKLVILDGNLALESLAQRDEFRDRLVLGIFESGRNVLQERGSTTFLGEALYYQLIEDFEEKLNWNSPDGIKIWGWR